MLLRKTHIVVLYLQYITDRRMDPVSCGVVTQMQGHDRDSNYMEEIVFTWLLLEIES